MSTSQSQRHGVIPTEGAAVMEESLTTAIGRINSKETLSIRKVFPPPFFIFHSSFFIVEPYGSTSIPSLSIVRSCPSPALLFLLTPSGRTMLL